MYLSHLSLTNFRNYSRLELDLPPGPVLLHGANAQGKTSLLEAIFYLATSRSPHTTADRELINWLAEEELPHPYARLMAELVREGPVEDGETQRLRIEIALQKVPAPGRGRLRKRIRVNGVPRRAMDLLGHLNVVLFLPQDVNLVAGSPEGRRRYLDITLCQVDRDYCRALSRYNQALARRNALLRQWQERRVDPDELAYWDELLTRHGVVVLLGRQALIAELSRRADPIHRELTGGAERLRLHYRPSFFPTHEGEAVPEAPLPDTPERRERWQRAYRAALEARRAEEIARGVTLLGPHRDELRFLVNDAVDLGTYGSRGQQRTAVLALKLAEVEWMRERTGEWPVLLLDEVLAELDPRRRRYLLARINGAGQVLVTTSDPALFDETFLRQAARFRVEGGRVVAASG